MRHRVGMVVRQEAAATREDQAEMEEDVAPLMEETEDWLGETPGSEAKPVEREGTAQGRQTAER